MDREESLTVKCSCLGPHSLFVIHFVCEVLTRQISKIFTMHPLENQKGWEVGGGKMLQSKERKIVVFCTTFFPTGEGLASQKIK